MYCLDIVTPPCCCVDMPVLSGNYPETCFAKYGSLSLKNR